MDISEWGLFIETTDCRTFEVALPEKLAQKVAKFLTREMEAENIVGMEHPTNTVDDCNTKGLIKW